MKNLNFPWNGVLCFGPKQFESVASADWVCDAVHDFLFIINIICKEGTEICGCMFAGYEGSICEFDRRLLSNLSVYIYTYIYILYIYMYMYIYIYICNPTPTPPPTVFNLCFYIVFNKLWEATGGHIVNIALNFWRWHSSRETGHVWGCESTVNCLHSALMAIIGRSVVDLWKVERCTGKERIIAEAEPPHSATCKDWALASLPVLIHPWISSWATWITAFIKYMRKLIVSSFMCHIGKIFPAANWRLKEQAWAKKKHD